jgi:5-methylcytosine-specific restriction endonuclease McrA
MTYKTKIKKCKQCGTKFKPNSNSQKYCKVCLNKTCLYCSKIFISPQRNQKQKYCSRTCNALGHPEKIKNLIAHRGTKPRTRHKTHRDKHGNMYDREWRTKIFKRDKYTCRNCGQVGVRLQAHHIKGYKEYPELRYILNNGLTLCVSCHKQTDNYGYKGVAKKRIEVEARQLKMFE